MAKKVHPYYDNLIIAALFFFACVFMTVFAALYVHSAVLEASSLPIEAVDKNTTPPGNFYLNR